MCVCVRVFSYMQDGPEFLALDPVRRIAGGVRLAQFRYGSVENVSRVRVRIGACVSLCVSAVSH